MGSDRINHISRANRLLRVGIIVLAASVTLTACDDIELPKLNFNRDKGADSETPPAADETITLVERDVEAPDVFQITEAALWDGRPSLGGVWVAYPGDIQPERVIIRNEENSKFVIGALFKRERENPGPKIQLSSDAAAALGILAGKPTVLNVTALRRESVPEVSTPDAAPPISEIAATAIDEAEGKDTTTPPPAPTPTPAPQPASGLAKPFIQIGIFSVEENARNTAVSLRTQGVVPTIKEHETSGKKFWRVIVGPASSKGERSALLKKAKDLGFADAYFVTN